MDSFLMHDFSLIFMSSEKLLRRNTRHPRQNERWRLFLPLDVSSSEETPPHFAGRKVGGTSGVGEKEEGQASQCPIAVCISCDSNVTK